MALNRRAESPGSSWPPEIILTRILLGGVAVVLLIVAVAREGSLFGARHVRCVVENRSTATIDSISTWDGDDGFDLGPVGPGSTLNRKLTTYMLDRASVRAFVAGHDPEHPTQWSGDFAAGFRVGEVRFVYDGHTFQIQPNL